MAGEYIMGHSEAELRRLETQAEVLGPVTRRLFREAGIGEGQTVLDFGCGAGDVSFLAAELVGPHGRVIGIDRSDTALATAMARAEQRGAANIRFLQGDESLIGTAAVPAGSVDAVVGRLVLMHQRQPAATLGRLVGALRSGGVLAFHEFHLAMRGVSSPRLTLLDQIWDWALEAARRAGLDVEMGIRLPGICRALGLADVEAQWMGRLTPGSDRMPFAVLAGVVRALLPVIVQQGLATADEVEIESLADRLHAEAAAADATVSWVTSVGVRARKP